MEDVKQTKPSLEIEPALVDGFLVREVYDGTGGNPGVLFAGTLSHCLAFMESRMRPAEEICAPDSPDVVRVGDLTREEIEQGYADAKRAPTQDPNIHRAGPVDLSKIGTLGVAEEWDAGVEAAYRVVAREQERKLRAIYAGTQGGFSPPEADETKAADARNRAEQETIRQSLIRELSVPANLPYRYRRVLSQREAQVILAALRQQDAQNAGRIEKDFK